MPRGVLAARGYGNARDLGPLTSRQTGAGQAGRTKLRRRDPDVANKLPRKIAKVSEPDRFANRDDILPGLYQELLRCVQTPSNYPGRHGYSG